MRKNIKEAMTVEEADRILADFEQKLKMNESKSSINESLLSDAISRWGNSGSSAQLTLKTWLTGPMQDVAISVVLNSLSEDAINDINAKLDSYVDYDDEW